MKIKKNDYHSPVLRTSINIFSYNFEHSMNLYNGIGLPDMFRVTFYRVVDKVIKQITLRHGGCCMIELLVKDQLLDLEQVSSLLDIDIHRLDKLCSRIEHRGYLFKRSEDGTVLLTEKDMMMILCFT